MALETQEKNAPSVGVAVVVEKNGRILLGEDFSKGGESVYGVPGGHWESGESLVDAVCREAFEESGVRISDVQLISIHDFFRADKDKSYVTIGFAAKWQDGELTDESPQTRMNWRWYNLDSLPSPIFPPDLVLIENYTTGRLYAGGVSTFIKS